TFADGSSANLEAALREALSGDLSRLRLSAGSATMRHCAMRARVVEIDHAADRRCRHRTDRPGT
ncbi:hypothetical protein, partial [Stenotrophomonas muris]